MRTKTALLVAAMLISACSAQAPSVAPAPAASLAPAPGPARAPPAPDPNLPVSAHGENWEYVVNNALRTTDRYATSKNPNAVFTRPCAQVTFVKQVAGRYVGRHLLMVTCDVGGDTSFAMMLPLFDENASSDKLDDSGELWKVVLAKFNGRKF